MKKLLLAIALLAAPFRAQAAVQMLDGQFQISVLGHGVGATEFTTKGETKLVMLLTPFQFGHYKGDYIVGQDAGIINNGVNTGRVATTFGIHLHVISLLRNLMTDSSILDGLDATPRVSYDSDVHKWVKSYMVGFEHHF